MSASSTIRKYIILAVSGALIIGIGTFLLLNSYFEKVEIIVAKTDILSGQEIEEKDIDLIQYYKNSLPAGFIEKKEDVIGKKLMCQRKAGDPVTASVFEQEPRKSIVEKLKEGEVLMALDISYTEPLIDELVVGSCISIVSTEKEKPESFTAVQNNNSTAAEDYVHNDISLISENIIIIDRQLIIRNLEI